MQFRSRNTTVLALCLAAALGLAGCRSESERRLGQSTRRELELGREAAERWLQSAGHIGITETDAIALGYLERLRLGLGSPFRLADYALADPRLPDSVRVRLGFALLGRTLDGKTFEIDPIVLDRVGTLGARSAPGLGARHLALIARAINDAEDPRVAEAAIRIAYTVATAEGLVSAEATTLAASVAALEVDRALARKDAARLLAHADELHPATALLRQWRSERSFAVEQPRIAPPNLADELNAIRTATRLLDALRALGLESSSRGLPHVAAAPASAVRLSEAAVERLGQAEAGLGAPPQTPIVLAARQLSRDANRLAWLSQDQRITRAKFGNHAVNEESFVVEHARLRLESPRDAAPARAALQAAVAMRAYAQEDVWFPGMDGPSQRDLIERYGLQEVTFDRTVRADWRPYYRRMLLDALEDLHRVLPTLSLRGLRVHFGSTSQNTDALAVHEPGKRRLLLPPLTSAGTLAHEIAHDIDWQVALRRYRIRGDYATDRAARGRNDALAAQIRSLASASLSGRVPDAPLSAHARRPAEVFARNVDWYVAVSLAGEGRRNGYLTSVQDELITGYGTVRQPDVSGAAGDALMSILSELAPVYREQRDAFRALYGSSRSLRAYDLVRRITEAPVNRIWARPFQDELDQLRAARDATLRAVDRAACAPAWNLSTELQHAQRELVLLTTLARARGFALQRLERTAPPTHRPSLVRQLYRGPMPVKVDSIAAARAEPLALAVNTLAGELAVVPVTPFKVHEARICTPSFLADN